jgi:hypothetical protein
MKYMYSVVFSVIIVASAVFGQDKPAMKVSGYMFGDYFYNVARDTSISSVSNASNGGIRDLNGFQFRRIYLTFDNTISSSFSTRLRLEGTTGAPFIKDAYLKWSGIFTGSDLTFGLQPTPAFEVAESYWGFRSLEKTILDLRGIAPSRDLGVSLKGSVTSDGMVNYWVLYGNNSSTGAETDKYKRLYAHIDLKPTEKLRATVYADYKMAANINDPLSTTTPKKTLNTNVLTAALFTGYTEKGSFSIGGEGFIQMFNNGYIHGAAPVVVEDKQALGLSLFGNYVITSDVSLVGRYDYYDPNTAAKNDLRQLFIAGACWNADKNVAITPNVQIETYEDAAAGTGTRSIDPSITGKITFYYTFL